MNSESEKRSHLIKRMAETLKKCYLLVVASGEAPEYLVKDYKNLLRQVQNIESVTFDPPNIGMSPLNSTMILSTPAFERKRKLEEEESSLNNTFVLPGSKETFLAKGGLFESYISAIAFEMMSGAINIVDLLRGKG